MGEVTGRRSLHVRDPGAAGTRRLTYGLAAAVVLLGVLVSVPVDAQEALAEGRRLFRARKYAESIQHFGRASADDPGNVQVRSEWAEALYLSGRHGEAATQYMFVLLKNEGHVGARGRMADIALEQKKLDAAREHRRALGEANQASTERVAQYAQACLSTGRIDEALAVVEPFLQSHPKDLAIALAAGKLLYAAERDDEALIHLARAAAQGDDSDADAHIYAARVHVRHSRWRKALGFLQTAHERRPDSMEVRTELAAVYEKLGQHASAIELLKGDDGMALRGTDPTISRLQGKKATQELRDFITLPNIERVALAVVFFALGLLLLTWTLRKNRTMKRRIGRAVDASSRQIGPSKGM